MINNQQYCDLYSAAYNLTEYLYLNQLTGQNVVLTSWHFKKPS